MLPFRIAGRSFEQQSLLLGSKCTAHWSTASFGEHLHVVFQPSHHDVHQDHQTIAQEGLRAFKRTTILGYEIPWNNFNFDHQAYVGLEERHVERKVAALAHYASQQHRNYANPEYIRNLARTHGINVNRAFAEVFEVYRVVS
jgi:LmbE family N-acetylglucosaminyl deacetylase